MLAGVLAAAGALGVLLIFIGLRYLMMPEVDLNARLDQMAVRSLFHRRPSQPKQGAISAGIERAVANRSFAANIARDLARANLKLTVSEYIMIHAILVLIFGGVTFALTTSPLGTLLVASLGLFLPRLYVSLRQNSRLNAFNSQLADTASLMANSLRSGYSLLQSMEMVAREGPSPTSEEFQRVVREVGLGLTPEQALANLVRRINSDDLDLMVTAINVQHEVGGNLALILDSISHTIRERVRIKGEIRTLTAQVSCSGNIVSILPIGLTLVLFLINPSYISLLFQPGWALCLPIAAAAGIIAGWFAMRKITQIEV